MVDGSDGFWSALFKTSKDDPIMIWVIRIILIIVAICVTISIPIYFVDKSENRHSKILFGLIEYFPKDTVYVMPNTIIRHDTVKIQRTDSLPKKSELIKKDTTSKNNTSLKTHTTISGNNNHTVIGENKGINGDVNIGTPPRIATKSDFAFFFEKFKDKTIKIEVDFVGLSATSEMQNLKMQYINILKENGYTNIEMRSGYSIYTEATPKQWVDIKDGVVFFHIAPQ